VPLVHLIQRQILFHLVQNFEAVVLVDHVEATAPLERVNPPIVVEFRVERVLVSPVVFWVQLRVSCVGFL